MAFPGCRRLTALLTLLAFRVYEASYGNPVRFLVVSSMRTAKISYCLLWPGNVTVSNSSLRANASFHASTIGSDQEPVCGQVRPLIDAGTIFPQGIAVDSKRRRLHVADPGGKKIYTFDLRADTLHKTLAAINPRVAVTGVESRWVTVDATGAIYFTDEASQLIMYVSDAQLISGNATAHVLYAGTSTAHVSSPGGIVTDTFATYWVNKVSGTMVGSVVRGGKTYDGVPPSTDQSTLYPVTRISDKSYGACMAKGNVYFTQQDKLLYRVSTAGGGVTTVTTQLASPRGCAYDGDGTVLIADRTGSVYAIPVMDGQAKLQKALDYEDAFGVAVLSLTGMDESGVLSTLSDSVWNFWSAIRRTFS